MATNWVQYQANEEGVYCLLSCFAFGRAFFDSFNVVFNKTILDCG